MNITTDTGSGRPWEWRTWERWAVIWRRSSGSDITEKRDSSVLVHSSWMVGMQVG